MSLPAATRRLLCLLILISFASSASPASPAPAPVAPVIVIGFVGGFVKSADKVHSVVQIAADLRRRYSTGVDVKVFPNHHREAARAAIFRLLDSNRDGILSPEEKKDAHIILYGHSWGASEVVTLARELNRQGIPVLLTVQVDSVAKHGENDALIPANVAEAANFYERSGFVHGEPEIRAVDPARTRILGNFRFDYKAHPVDCKAYPWYDRVFMKTHTEIECDPKVWAQVEALIQSKIPESKSPE